MSDSADLPAPPPIEGWVWHPLRREDIPALHRFWLALDQADHREWKGSREELEQELEDPWSPPETNSLIALTPEGEVAALARVFANPSPEDKGRAYLDSEVHPLYRGRGLEDFLLSWAEARGRQWLNLIPAGLQRAFRVGCPDNLRDRMAQFEQRGYRHVRSYYRMRRNLREPIPDRNLPPELQLRPYAPEMDLAVMEAFNASFRDHWGFETVSEKDWRLFFTQAPAFRPDLTLLAMDGGLIAGFSMNYLNREENERQGIQQGWIGQVGVLRAWRKRGIASALLCHSMRRFRTTGLDYATLGVDTENLTGAVGLYERLGFVVAKRYVAYTKEVD